MLSSRKSILALGATVLAGGTGGAAIVAVASGDRGSTTTTVTQAAAPASGSTAVVAQTSGGALTPAQVYERSKGAVVFITSKVDAPTNSPFGPQRQQGAATGSGFVIDPSGYIVTNAHVVSGASSVSVKIGDGTSQAAKIVGVDESTDVALLKVDGAGKLPTLTLGDSDAVKVGDPSYAIGNPYGLDRTLTTGVISALARSITAPNGYTISNVIQTDAALNPGNSGGPLFNTSGEVIGINSQIESSGSASGTGQNSGVGFAVPSDTVKRVVEQLRTTGKATHAYLGVGLTGDETGNGARVGSVTDGGPADDGGLKAGDVVTAINGDPVRDGEDLTSDLDALVPGNVVTLKVKRAGGTVDVKVKLGIQPSRTDAAQSRAGQEQPAPTFP